MKNPYKEFNLALKTYIREIMGMYPDMQEVKTMHTVYKLSKSINRKLPQALYNRFIAEPYQDAIISREEFFMRSDFSMQTEFMNSVIPFIQGAWSQMDDASKEANWQHMSLLIAINRECNAYAEAKSSRQPMSMLMSMLQKPEKLPTNTSSSAAEPSTTSGNSGKPGNSDDPVEEDEVSEDIINKWSTIDFRAITAM